jgi:hypothetical protein
MPGFLMARSKLLRRDMASDPSTRSSSKETGDIPEPQRRASTFILNNLLAGTERRSRMSPEELREAEPAEAARFLDTGKEIGQEHLQKALSNALKRIDELSRELAIIRKT